MAYELEGELLEVCNCNVLCPCWIGEDPDNGTCDAVLAYHITKGAIDGVDVAGHPGERAEGRLEGRAPGGRPGDGSAVPGADERMVWQGRRAGCRSGKLDRPG